MMTTLVQVFRWAAAPILAMIRLELSELLLYHWQMVIISAYVRVHAALLLWWAWWGCSNFFEASLRRRQFRGALLVLIEDFIRRQLFLVLNLLIHVELSLNFSLHVRKGGVCRVGYGGSVWVDWPFARGVRLILLWNDRSVRFLHHLQVDRSANGWSTISSTAPIALTIVWDPISLRVRATIRRHSIPWLALSFLRLDPHNDVLFNLVIHRIINLILAYNWACIVLFILRAFSCRYDLIPALSHAFRLFCNEDAGGSLRLSLYTCWVYQTKFLEERSLFFSLNLHHWWRVLLPSSGRGRHQRLHHVFYLAFLAV